ncbi:chromosome segregation in meiosis- protein [Exophiala dermatitidis]|uniref:Chromosome segregation in meiosis protein n=2 Tax=Exophiala dermatitidis TaxID=5970 RepID=H6C5T4_EXODN|nr:replication fork protection complex subunit Swi3/Csm3 [Exophiala dermatitidis NIH/UT8656]KAJ4516322.1 chromosome segregation in meiosis- protein [Exophiala dermatitidis]EHY59080.1 replication fork protection complex subunit Swi3/Csm3 [Exophiala dermatitidis NIH/UT8656]KAJ4523129.1 chromosome segregation in meiosis- protein [Exophiala dermatitidis]KAJ4526457.1 chromosome segregation in meiosis- protein [Exophiala dermatitidis]KAJ4532298.1 chromosome segregation in meiosis- protein [Exophiala
MATDPLTAATVDDLFNFDSTDDEDPFKDKSTRKARDDKTTLSPRPAKRKAGDNNDLGADLGLDEEVKIAKKRKPIAKLDEARLLSAEGIPKLRALAMSGKFSKKLRLKGKGHEFSDVARLLNYYQLWLDNLYPRAKFADGLQLIEKVGHSKRMQTMRKEWIDEGKPGYVKEKASRPQDGEKGKKTDELYGGDEPAAEPTSNELAPGDDSLFIPDTRASDDVPNFNDEMPEDDELDALLAEQETAGSARPAPPPTRSKRTIDDDSEGEDDPDALLAEQDTRRVPQTATATPPVQSKSTSRPKTSPFEDDDDDEEDMDDLDALLAEQEARATLTTTQPRTELAPRSTNNESSPRRTEEKEEATKAVADNDDLGDLDLDLDEDDDLDALLAEQELRQTEAAMQRPSQTSTTNTGISSPRPSAHAEQPDLDVADGDDMFSSSPVRTNPNTKDFQASYETSVFVASSTTKALDDMQQGSEYAQGAGPKTTPEQEYAGGLEAANPSAEVELEAELDSKETEEPQQEHEQEQEQNTSSGQDRNEGLERLDDDNGDEEVEAPQETTAQEGRRGGAEKQGAAEVGPEAEVGLEDGDNEELEAEDMFSSSPVQNDD